MPSADNSRSTQARSGVFISYARDDGEELASVLRMRLETEGIPLWQDRVRMEGGRDWWLQITAALDQVEFMALVITPEALKSDTVRKEWRYARQQGVCVYPIKGTPDLDFDSLPRWMRSAHFYDLEREWPKFVNDLNTSCRIPRVPFMAPDLPEGFVPRPREFDQLLRLLIDERQGDPVAITAALKGAGGYGKTTLATALCHDQRIQDAFDEGILWVTLGERPKENLTGLVEDLIIRLGDEPSGFTAPHAAVSRLKELLADRDILMVIDDVWDPAHLNPFIQGGPRCARLITTRNLDTLPASATKVPVDAMRQNEAMAVLTAGLSHPSLQDATLSRELTALASRLGEWPLLLRLVNSALRNRINIGQSLPDAMIWINTALDEGGLGFFDARNSDERSYAVAKTIGVSLDLLSEQERDRYRELAIFPEDVEIPLATLEKLWARTGGLKKFATEVLCDFLNRLSLLWSYDVNRQLIRLHDVVRKFLIEQQRDKLPLIHAQLLDAHRPAGNWSEMSTDEPYFWEHLAHHLIEAGRGNELVATVKDWRYLVAKTLMRKSLAVEADLLASEQIAVDDEPLRLLRRNFVNSGHLLNRCENRDDIEASLFSRLRHLDELKSITTDLDQHLKRPCLVPASELPDLPHPALVRTLSGHTGWVNACAVSADGATIVSASADQTLKVWDGRSGADRFTLRGHAVGVNGGVESFLLSPSLPVAVNGCAVSADGATIISASSDQTLKVWDGRSGVERFTLRGHTDRVRGCAVSADGATIVSASDDQTLKVWEGRSGVERFTLKGHAGTVNACAVSADGATIVSASSDQTLKVWDGRSGVERFTLRDHADRVRGCAVSADGATIVSASDDQTLKVWEGRSGVERFTLKGHAGTVNACAVSADGATIVSASSDRTLKVWDGRSGTERFTLRGHAVALQGCAVSADGAMIVSASLDQTLKVWDGRSGPGQSSAGRFTLTDHAGWMKDCAVSADGATIVSASSDQTLKVWDGRSGAERFTLKGHASTVNACAVSADGAAIVSASLDQTVKVWDGRNGTERFTLRGPTGLMQGCAVSSDGATIVSASDQTLKVWDGRSGAERFTLRVHMTGAKRDYLKRMNGCAVSADGTTIVSAADDGMLKVWDGRSGAERFTLRGDLFGMKGCAVSADGGMVVSATYDWTLKVWDGRSGAERFTLKGHASMVNAFAVSAATIVSASDQTVKVWDARTGECLATLHVDGPLRGCSCSADGKVIAAAGPRGIYFLRLVR